LLIAMKDLLRPTLAFAWIVFAALAFGPGIGSAQIPSQLTGGEDPLAQEDEALEWPTADELASERAELEEEISQVEARLDNSAGELEVSVVERLETKLDLLRRLDRLVGDQEGELERREALRSAEDSLEERSTAAPQSLVDPEPPFSVAQLDVVLDQRDAASAKNDTLRDTLETERRNLADARDRRERREAEARELEQEVEAVPGDRPSEAAQTRSQLQLAELESRVASAAERAQELEVENLVYELELQERRVSLWREAENWVRSRLQPSEEEKKEILSGLESEEESLRSELEKAAAEVEAAEDRLRQARNRLPDGADANSPEQARVEAASAELELAEEREKVIGAKRDRVAKTRETWELRYQLLSGRLGNPADLRRAEEKLRGWIRELENKRDYVRSQLDLARRDLRSAESRLAEAPAGSSLAGYRERERDAFEALVATYGDELERLDQLLVTARRPLGEIEASIETFDWSERLADGWKRFLDIWSFEVFTVQGSPIEVNQIVLALLLLILGFRISRFLSLLFVERFLSRFKLDRGAQAALQTIIFYLLLVLFVVWALQLVEIPLTVFTFLGGALAIGVGFGSQAVVNNFISGLIMLVERPVKVGDLIDVGPVQGRVESIGPRSTQIRSGDNTHVIVPNSNFLESNVLNWTVSDNVLRFKVTVGVAYGSPVREVEKLMMQALEEEAKVLDRPPPEVLFEDFGDSALVFDGYFWIELRNILDRNRVQSALRFRIDELFHDAGITIAFPQRDVHLDTLSPIEIKMVERRREPSAPRED